jgi:hypothetical protein
MNRQLRFSCLQDKQGSLASSSFVQTLQRIAIHSVPSIAYGEFITGIAGTHVATENINGSNETTILWYLTSQLLAYHIARGVSSLISALLLLPTEHNQVAPPGSLPLHDIANGKYGKQLSLHGPKKGEGAGALTSGSPGN